MACGQTVSFSDPAGSGGTGGGEDTTVSVGEGGSTTTDSGSGGTGGGEELVSFSMYVFQGPNQPVVGAGVVLDLGDDGRVESLSDPSGAAFFEDVPLAKITAAIAHKDGYTFSAVDVAIINPQFPVLQIVPLGGPGGLEVSGELLNVDGTAGNNVGVGVTIEGSIGFSSDEGDDSYAVTVPAGAPFTLYSIESAEPVFDGQSFSNSYVNAWMLDVDALSEDTTIDIDFAGGQSVTPDELAVSFPIPDDQDLAENGSGAVQVVAPSGALLGGTVASDINNAGDGFEATVQWLSPTSTELRTRYLVFIEDGPVTLVTTDGGPIANAGTLDFVATPYLTDAGAPHGLHDSLSWSLSDGDTPDSVIMTVFDDEGGLGNVIVPANAPSVRVPELPDSSDADAHFDGVDLQAVVFSCGFVMGEGCTRFSRDELITLEP